MKKLLIIPFVLLAMATPAYVVSQHPKVVVKEVPVTVTKTVTQTVPALVPSYHVGDTQGNMTLLAVYGSRQTINPMSHSPYEANVITFKIDTDVGDLQQQSLIYTNSGGYIKPTEGPYASPSCSGTCLSFILPSNTLADTFIYKDFKWYL